MFLNPRPSGLCRLITQYLFTRSQWRLWGLFAIVLAAYAFNIKLAVLYNDWNGRFFNALQAVNRDAIFRELFYFIGLAAVIIVLLVWAGYVKDRLALALRRDLTQIFFKRWLSPESAHYLLRESGREPDNPDQRVTEDVRQLVNLSVDLLVSFYDAMLTIGSFSVILGSSQALLKCSASRSPATCSGSASSIRSLLHGLHTSSDTSLKASTSMLSIWRRICVPPSWKTPSCRCHRRGSC